MFYKKCAWDPTSRIPQIVEVCWNVCDLCPVSFQLSSDHQTVSYFHKCFKGASIWIILLNREESECFYCCDDSMQHKAKWVRLFTIITLKCLEEVGSILTSFIYRSVQPKECTCLLKSCMRYEEEKTKTYFYGLAITLGLLKIND